MKEIMKQVEALTKEREEIFARVNEIMKKMEKVDEKISKKLVRARKNGELESGGYIATGNEEEGFFDELESANEMQEDRIVKEEKEERRKLVEEFMALSGKVDEIDAQMHKILENLEKLTEKPGEPGNE